MASSATPLSATSEPSVPSTLQIAFALAIVRSKPAGVPVREQVYLMKLREHLKEGPLYRQQSPAWVLDQIAFWKGEHEAAEVSKAQLQARVSDLEQQVERLKESNATNTLQDDTGFTGSVSGLKRKQVTLTRPTKKPKLKLDAGANLQRNLTSSTLTTHLEPLESIGAFGEEGLALLRSVFQVQRLCKGPEPDALTLSYHVASIASSIGSVINVLTVRDCQDADAESDPRLPGPVKAKRKAASDIAHVVRAIACAFSTLLLGLSYIPKGTDCEDFTAHVVYSCARMFQVALRAIAEAAKSKALQTTVDTAAPDAQLTTTKSKARQTASPPQDLTRAVTHFLNACLSALVSTEYSHRDIFEAFMYVLLDRVGRRIYRCTFSHERGQTSNDDIRLGAEPESELIELNAKSLAFEVPCLVSVLERSLSVAPQLLGPILTGLQRSKTTTKGKQSSSSKTISVTKVLLHMDAKERLQRTLVNAIFGPSDSTGTSACLTKPLPSSKIPIVPQDDDSHTADWFRQQVWKLVGWGILGREGDW